jgi:hypothetical protein
MVLAHTIIALEGGKPARVECNTCHGQHNFRAASPEPRTSAPKAPRAEGGSRSKPTFDSVMAKHTGPTRAYSPKSTFAVDETLSHPTFGRGFVSAVRADKIDVTFSAGVKTLIHAKG